MLCWYIIGYLPFIPLSVQVSSQLNSRGHVGYFFCPWVEIYSGNIQQMSIHKQVRLFVCVRLFHLPLRTVRDRIFNLENVYI